MKKILWIILSSILLGVVLYLPFIFNNLSFKWEHLFTNENVEPWVNIFVTYYGAILGGLISGAITLTGVIITINNNARRNSAKDRLFYLYHPVERLLNYFHFSYGAHHFDDLTKEEQEQLLSILSKNLLYADAKVYKNILELHWIYKSDEHDGLNERYIEISYNIHEQIEELRKILHLPKID